MTSRGPSVEALIAQRVVAAESLARQHEANADIASAIEQWLVVGALRPARADVSDHLDRLGEAAKKEAARLAAQAKAATKRRRYLEAKQRWLAAISLTPDDAQLRSDYAQAQRSREYQRWSRRLAQSETEPASATVEVQQPPVGNAELIYQRALELLSSDVSKAKSLFREVLSIDSTHLGARAYLESLP
ncbi:MAG: hypothetical protein AAF515_02370 [Pseudomonadota bacterium]